ncbi:probable CCR4-associated factor 1 homolog 11 [Populus nigra]|uniref:probable CCR4-associated factor 1 homolog 11 n=1 Tax=Populus nigra TaxID=3691 RepID=UPI002B268308|nr:probable CCR4-associated factor 1 homolog 11 [Populus nigra]
MKSSKPVHLREVWTDNLVYEFFLIKEAISRFPLVALDTEFPGTIFQLNRDKSWLSHATPYENYCLMKWNVDLLKIIQLGMALSDSHGNLPSFGTEFHYAWQFNFRDFNIKHDHHNEESIGLLERQGIDLKKNREKGIDSSDFERLILSLLILTKRELPSDMRSFLGMMRFFFGVRVYDTKFMMGCISGLHGGLERVAMLLGVERITGSRHQAGSDSLSSLQTFVRFKESCAKIDLEKLNGYEGMMFGLCEGWLGFTYAPDTFMGTLV